MGGAASERSALKFGGISGRPYSVDNIDKTFYNFKHKNIDLLLSAAKIESKSKQ